MGFLSIFENQTGMVGMVQAINTNADNKLGFFIFVAVLSVVLIMSIRTTEPTKALILSWIIGLFTALGLAYLQILSMWWVALMVLLLIGTILYDHFTD